MVAAHAPTLADAAGHLLGTKPEAARWSLRSNRRARGPGRRPAGRGRGGTATPVGLTPS